MNKNIRSDASNPELEEIREALQGEFKPLFPELAHYSSQPKSLTDEQIIEIARDEITLFDEGASICTQDSLIAFARALLETAK